MNPAHEFESLGRAPRIVVLGGGVAGLCAALALAEEGCEVHLYEKRKLLGGRASSFVDPADGELVDNCQHVTMRCCTNLDDFFRRIHAQRSIAYSRRIDFLDKERNVSTIESAPLPAPFHLFPSLLRFRAVSWIEKAGIAWAMLRILFLGPNPERLDRVDFKEWLKKNGQSERCIRRFWSPILVSALNEEMDRVSARAAIQVVYEGLLKNRNGYEVGLPTENLAEIYSEKGGEKLKQLGVALHLGETAERIVVEGFGEQARAAKIAFQGGSVESFDKIVCTVPFHSLLDLLPERIAEEVPFFSCLKRLGSSPITGIHLWFDRPVSDRRFLALLDSPMQWMFTRILDGGSGDEGYVSLVVSASRELVSMSREKIVEIAMAELHEAFPSLRRARLLKSKVIKERYATYSASPGAEVLRPDVRTPVKGFFLAGDWVKSGWPATMEGAARSGYKAAEEVLKDFEIAKSFVRPSLSAEGLLSLRKRDPDL